MFKIDIKKPFWFWLSLLILLALLIFVWSITVSGILNDCTKLISRGSKYFYCFNENPNLYILVVLWSIFISSISSFTLFLLLKAKITKKI